MRALPGRLVLLGHPVGHSLSPRFQNAALRRAALPLTYEALDVPPDMLEGALDELVAANAAGNVTIPHKQAVFARCARRSALAERVGAVNTFWIDDGVLVGDNTDVAGFLDLLWSAVPNADPARPAAVIGAGGSAGAVLTALEHEGFENVRVHGRTAARAIALCERFGRAAPAISLVDAVRGASLVVNATPAGLDGRGVPFDVDLVEPDAALLDLVYAQGRETPLVDAARARGLVAASGLEMLLGQGARAFELWFGTAPDRTVMREALAAETF
ncbi:MAG TPA: shikimate dehydrogenase [Gemmatimonadaceae bacterium]|nr:shikimate dehydrogenase [Gemmatimonadaceae bacterium]